MIQFLKSYEHNGVKIVIGQKVNFDPIIAQDLIKRGIARPAKWTGKVEKMKTNFFKPKG